MNVTPEDVMRAGRQHIGAGWVHRGRSEKAMDCGGLLVLVARELGLKHLDVTGYSRRPGLDNGLQKALLAAGCTPCALQPGAVALMWFLRLPQHLGIITQYQHGGLGLLHSYSPGTGVVEHHLDTKWRTRIVSTWALPGVTYP